MTAMRIPVIAGNWKMHKKAQEAVHLAKEIECLVPFPGSVEVVIAPPFLALPFVAEACKESYIGVAAQNMHWEDEGAFTGEVSGAMIKDLGCEYVIIGHSERRQHLCETDETVNKKVSSAIRHNLVPIVCIGETLSERQNGETFERIQEQLGNGLPNLSVSEASKLIIAYEPVWAIGTGKTATPDQAEEVHAFVRSFLAELLGPDPADSIRILYGGSAKPENAKDLLGQPNIDGGLIGGASLKAESFAQIIKAARA